VQRVKEGGDMDIVKVSGVRFQVSAQPLAKKTAGLIEKETLPLASFIRWVN
jgi:hypothetical protein